MDEAVGGEEVVAVAFSGGLDSSVLVQAAKKSSRVLACCGYSAGSRDAEWAREAASALGADFVATEIDSRSLAAEVERMVLPFEPTLMDRSLWCLYSMVSKSARDAGAGVILLGQMADELFGGYAKYAEALASKGEAEARRIMDQDVAEYDVRGGVRDLTACARWAEPRFPFGSKAVREFAASIPLDFKIRGGVRKAVLREAALMLGVPGRLADAPKKAAQYSSGVQKLVSGSRF